MNKHRTVQQLIADIASDLKTSAPLIKPENTAWWLLEKATNKSRGSLITQQTIQLSLEQSNKLESMILSISEGTPLQYVLGTVPFGDLQLIVRPPIFIPRPETEEMCEWLIAAIRNVGAEKLDILDLCTGPGTIALSLANAFPTSHVTAVDINPNALTLAQENAVYNDIKNVTFLESDLYSTLEQKNQFDLIVSNPPYVTEQEWREMDPLITDWEDKRAFVAQHGGLSVYTTIIQNMHKYLRAMQDASGLPSLVVEIGHNQATDISSLLTMADCTDIAVYKDINGKNRWICANFDTGKKST